MLPLRDFVRNVGIPKGWEYLRVGNHPTLKAMKGYRVLKGRYIILG
jgi:hypothetical protein